MHAQVSGPVMYVQSRPGKDQGVHILGLPGKDQRSRRRSSRVHARVHGAVYCRAYGTGEPAKTGSQDAGCVLLEVHQGSPLNTPCRPAATQSSRCMSAFGFRFSINKASRRKVHQSCTSQWALLPFVQSLPVEIHPGQVTMPCRKAATRVAVARAGYPSFLDRFNAVSSGFQNV